MEQMTAGMDKPRSYFERVVCLRTWWLVKIEKSFDGKQLAVAGFSNKEKEARRVFTSAPILKRHDDFNLETVDGISVNLHGFIDKARTEANGFSSEFFQHFLFGFPAWWEECAKKCLNKESMTELFARNNTDINAASPQGANETADEDIMLGCLDSSNADEGKYQSAETVRRNHSSVSNVEKQEAKHREDTTNSNLKKRMKKFAQASRNSRSVKNDLTSVGKRKRGATINVNFSGRETSAGKRKRKRSETTNVNLSRRETSAGNRKRSKTTNANLSRRETSAGKRKGSAATNVNLSRRDFDKKSAHVNESTPVHDTVPIVSPEAASFRRSRSGRLLLPALEYWHNQRAVYDVDRKIIGVKGILDQASA